MRKGISVFLGLEMSTQENLEYMRLARKKGFTEIFTSMHIPEANYDIIEKDIKVFLGEAKKLNMSVSVDISPNTFSLLGVDENDFAKLKDFGIDVVRLDFGYSIDEIAELTNNDYGLNIQLNASTLNAEMLLELESKGANYKNVTACHNYYPREDTGVSEKLFLERNKEFNKRGIEISAFVPCNGKKRGPVYEGLPTLEKHRKIDPYMATKHLFALGTNIVYFGDMKALDRELSMVGKIKTPFEFRVKFKTLNEGIKQYMLNNEFSQRIDEAENVIRIEESRYYFSDENPIEKECVGIRPIGTITIDNKDYLRYMGEMQISKINLDYDERVNIVGSIVEEDLFLLNYIKGGDKMNFIV